MNPYQIVQPEDVYYDDLDGTEELYEALRMVLCPDSEPDALDGGYTADELVCRVAQMGWRKVEAETTYEHVR